MTAPRSSPGPRLLSDEERARGDAMLRALRDMDAELTTDEQHEFAALANEAAEFILSLLTALSTAREAGERHETALHEIQAKGFEWAGENDVAPNRLAVLATIAVEALHPRSEADEMDCRSYCK